MNIREFKARVEELGLMVKVKPGGTWQVCNSEGLMLLEISAEWDYALCLTNTSLYGEGNLVAVNTLMNEFYK